MGARDEDADDPPERRERSGETPLGGVERRDGGVELVAVEIQCCVPLSRIRRYGAPRRDGATDLDRRSWTSPARPSAGSRSSASPMRVRRRSIRHAPIPMCRAQPGRRIGVADDAGLVPARSRLLRRARTRGRRADRRRHRPGAGAYLGEARGCLRERLDAVGIAFDDVVAVIFTHLHFDHVGWASLPDGDGRDATELPARRYVVGRREWQFWVDRPSRRDGASPRRVRARHPCRSRRRASAVVDDGASPIDGFTYRPPAGQYARPSGRARHVGG